MKKIMMGIATAVLCFILCFSSFAHDYEDQRDLSRVPEKYRDLYDRIPKGAFSEDGVVTYDSLLEVSYGTPEQMIIYLLYKAGLLSRPDNGNSILGDGPEVPRISAQRVKTVFENAFGEGRFSSVQKKEIRSGDNTTHLIYEETTDSYRLLYHEGGGGLSNGAWDYTCFLRGETLDDTVEIYVGYLAYRYEENGTWSFFHDAKAVAYLDATAAVTRVPDSAYGRILRGDFDSYLPVYKHVFKENGEGGYYWASCQMVQVGKEIPEEVIFPDSSKETDSSQTLIQDTTFSFVSFSQESDAADLSGEGFPAYKWISWGVVGVLMVFLFLCVWIFSRKRVN